MDMGTDVQGVVSCSGVEDLDQLVGVVDVPQHFEAEVKVVSRVDMSLSEELLLRVGIKCALDPVKLLLGHGCLVSMVRVEGVHAIQAQDHQAVVDVVLVVATLKPTIIKVRRIVELSIGWHFFEPDLAQSGIVFVLEFGSGGLVVIDDVIVTDDRQEDRVREELDDSIDQLLHSSLHLLPVRVFNWLFAVSGSQSVHAGVAWHQNGVEAPDAISNFSCVFQYNFKQFLRGLTSGHGDNITINVQMHVVDDHEFYFRLAQVDQAEQRCHFERGPS